jgi:hypothetical protein
VTASTTFILHSYILQCQEGWLLKDALQCWHQSSTSLESTSASLEHDTQSFSHHHALIRNSSALLHTSCLDHFETVEMAAGIHQNEHHLGVSGTSFIFKVAHMLLHMHNSR